MSNLPSLEEPEPGTRCKVCGELVNLVDFCGACAERADEQARYDREHERRQGDPLRLKESEVILQLAEVRRRTRAYQESKS